MMILIKILLMSLKSWNKNKIMIFEKNDYLSSFITNTDTYYQKWVKTYKKDLLFMFKELLYQLKKNNLSNKDYSFNLFCNLIYSKSSKIILDE